MSEENWTDQQLYYLFVVFWTDYWEGDAVQMQKASRILEGDEGETASDPKKPRVRMSLEVFTQHLACFVQQRQEFLQVWKAGYHTSCRTMTTELRDIYAQEGLSEEEQFNQVMALLKKHNRYVFLI